MRGEDMSLIKSMLRFFEVVESGRGPPVNQGGKLFGRYVIRSETNLAPIISDSKSLNFQYKSL